MSKTAIVFTCSHADPKVSNERFDWLGSLIYDVRPDYVVDLGDGADMASLSSFDNNNPKAITANSYEQDINSYLDAQERLRARVKKAKVKRPKYIGFEGNHEHRIKLAVSKDPRLEGSSVGISFDHLQTNVWFDEYHEYDCGQPALTTIDGILYGHYITSGAYGKAMVSKHHGHALVEKTACSTTVGHSHAFSYYHKGDARPRPLHGLVAGCFKGAKSTWAGQSNDEWRYGVVIKRYIEEGDYDMTWVSLKQLEREYGPGRN